MTHNPMLLFFMFIVCLFTFGFLVNLFFPARPKKAVFSGAPHEPIHIQVGNIIDAIDNATNIPKVVFAEALIESFVKHNKHEKGIHDDVDEWKKQLSAIRNKILSKGLRTV